jgi:hypothetical protein
MDKHYVPERIYVKLPRKVALALREIAQAQTGEMTDPRKVVCAIVEDTMLRWELIDEKTFPSVNITRYLGHFTYCPSDMCIGGFLDCGCGEPQGEEAT